jgi:hypothetical protein
MRARSDGGHPCASRAGRDEPRAPRQRWRVCTSLPATPNDHRGSHRNRDLCERTPLGVVGSLPTRLGAGFLLVHARLSPVVRGGRPFPKHASRSGATPLSGRFRAARSGAPREAPTLSRGPSTSTGQTPSARRRATHSVRPKRTSNSTGIGSTTKRWRGVKQPLAALRTRSRLRTLTPPKRDRADINHLLSLTAKQI